PLRSQAAVYRMPLRSFQIAPLRSGENFAGSGLVRFGDLEPDATRRGKHVGRRGLPRQLIRYRRRNAAARQYRAEKKRFVDAVARCDGDHSMNMSFVSLTGESAPPISCQID